MTEPTTVDCRGLACPEPVIRTKSALARAASPIVVLVDSEASCTNVRRFAESQGARVSVARREGALELTIAPVRDIAARAEEARVAPVTRGPGPTRDLVVFIASAGVGHGDDELGATLMAAFLDTLSQLKDEVSHLICVNAGARLAASGSPVLDELRQLEQVGVQILVCGTCLNHFGLTDQLAVGSVSNMYAIIETLSKAGRIIRP